ncbi:hypothetical protein AAULH_14146, partial [Lactobacillus helveticus MTCC 5463]
YTRPAAESEAQSAFSTLPHASLIEKRESPRLGDGNVELS